MASDRTDGALTHVKSANLGPTASVPTLSSGAAAVINQTLDTDLCISVIGGASGGNVTVTMGPVTGTENTVLGTRAIAASTCFVVNLHVPAGWLVKLTGTSTVVFTDQLAVTS